MKKLSAEPMVLQKEYDDILREVKRLNKRRNQIKREMKQFGMSPIRRSAFFDKPILLYALELEDNCWYIGMSRNVEKRYKAHLKGKTLWTGLHKPLRIHEIRETLTNNDSEAGLMEDQMTLEYARQWGTDFVRGGGYCQKKPQWPHEFNEPDLSWV